MTQNHIPALIGASTAVLFLAVVAYQLPRWLDPHTRELRLRQALVRGRTIIPRSTPRQPHSNTHPTRVRTLQILNITRKPSVEVDITEQATWEVGEAV